MQSSFCRFYSGMTVVVVGICVGSCGRSAWSAERIYTLVTAESVITASGSIDTVDYGTASIQTQGAGSLTTTYSGTIRTDRVQNTVNSVAFIGGSVIDANTNGSWQPTATGGSGSALADYGGRATFAGGLATANLAGRDLIADLLSGAVTVTNGTTGTFPVTSTDVAFDSGTIAYRATAFLIGTVASGFESLAGESGALGGVNPGSISITSLGGGVLRETLTIPINSTIVLSNVSADIDSVTLTLIGQLKATSDFADDGLRYWNNTAGGTFSMAANWNPSLTPGATETAIFTLGTNYAVDFAGAATNDRLRVGNTNQVTFNLGTNNYSLTDTSTSAPSVVVGETAAVTSRLTLAGTGAGGSLSSVHSYLGSVATSTGQMFVNAGATWNSSGELSVGRSGTGALTIQSGGDFVAPAGGITYVGYATGSSGSVTVTGAGSTMTNGQLYVGRQGTGTMTVSTSGLVSSTTARIGNQATGSVTVSGASTFTSTSTLFVGETVQGTLSIQSASILNSVTTNIGTSTGSNSTVTITGNGSTWNNSANLLLGGTASTSGGQGTVNINSGGDFIAPVGGITYVGYATGSTGSVTVTGAGSTMTNGQLFVGRQGTGTMTVSTSGLVSSTTARIGSQATGGVTVGTTSTFTNTTELFVGESAQGTMSIQSGSILNSVTTNIGTSTGSNSTVTITGNGTTWNNSANLLLGGTASASGGQGNVNINTGGDFVAPVSGITYVGYATGSTGAVTVTGSGSTMTNGQLYVGRQGTGTMTVSTSALVSSTTARIGSQATGSVTVSGASTFNNTTQLFVGEQAQGTLNIQSASILNTVTTNIGSNAGSNGTLTITGTSSVWNNTGSAYVGGTSAAAGNQGTLHINANASVTIGNTLKTYALGSINLNSGKLKSPILNISQGTFNQTGGQLVATTVTGNLTRAGGTLTPGDSAAAGQTSVTGDYIQQAGAALAIEIGGFVPSTQYDRLLIGGTGTLAGTLNVSLINGFVPTFGSDFVVLAAAGAINGQFLPPTLPTLDDELEWLVNYEATAVILSVGLKGDFNGNGVVDAADYALWRDAIGTPAKYSEWQNYFGATGSGSGGSSSLNPVPEPATWALFAVATIPLLVRSLRRRHA